MSTQVTGEEVRFTATLTSSRSPDDSDAGGFQDAAASCFDVAAEDVGCTVKSSNMQVVFTGLTIADNLENSNLDRLCRCMRTYIGETTDFELSEAGFRRESSSGIFHEWKALSKPNIMFVLTDDHGWADVGWHDYEESNLESATPFLDTLVTESVRLERMYTAPVCSPSRTMLWTGRYYYRTGYGPAVSNGQIYGVSGHETLLPEILKGNGYHGALLGKWHQGYQDQRHWPTFRGFDNHVGPFSLNYLSRVQDITFSQSPEIFAIASADIPNMATLHNGTMKAGKLSYENELPPLYNSSDSGGIYESMHGTDIIGIESKRFVDMFYSSEARNTPLFLNVAFRAPHATVLAPERYSTDAILSKLFTKASLSEYRRDYLCMIHAADAGVEATVEAMRSEYAWHDTVFIFSSDNGGLSTKKGGASNYPLMGQKNTMWEGGIRVATLLRGTESSLAALDDSVKGTASNLYLHYVDMMPTLATGIAGIPVEDYKLAWKCPKCLPHRDNILDGRNLWDAIRTGLEGEEFYETRVLSVVPEEQTDLSEDLEKLLKFVPDYVRNVSFYDGTIYESLVKASSDGFTWAAQQERIARHGGGVVQYGPYKLVFGFPSSYGKPNFPWDMTTSDYRTRFRSTPNNGGVAINFDVGSEGIPRGHFNKFFMFNVEDDEGERKNLLRSTYLNADIKAIVNKMFEVYRTIQQPEEAVVDHYLKYSLSGDPAQVLVASETKAFFHPFCDQSLRCKYDSEVVRPPSVTDAPTTAPTLAPTSKPTISPTKSPSLSPSASPTLYPTSFPTLAPTRAPTTEPGEKVEPSQSTMSPTATPTHYPTSLPTKQPTDLKDASEVLSSELQSEADALQNLSKRKHFPRGCAAYIFESATIPSSVSPYRKRTYKAKYGSWKTKCWSYCNKHYKNCVMFSAEKISNRKYVCRIYAESTSYLEQRISSTSTNIAALGNMCFT